jgi:hypothetical protein
MKQSTKGQVRSYIAHSFHWLNIRTEIIQTLINRSGAKKYLEIGIGNGRNYRNIKCDYKTSVDIINFDGNHYKMPSDKYFTENNEKYDVIFIDGKHESEQVYRDIINSLKILNNGGYIVCHDMLPENENMQLPFIDQEEWTGDCWKAWIKIRQQRDDLNMFVVNVDYGCGVIYKGAQELLPGVNLTYDEFVKNKNTWMNIITLSEFYGYFDSNTDV